MSRDDKRVRFARSDFLRWMESRGMPQSLLNTMMIELGGKETKALLGCGTSYEIPTRQRLIEFPITPSISLEEVLDDTP
jgi:hypothetical protein